MRNQYLKTVKSKNKYREFIKVLNGLLQLSDRERDILSILIEIDDNWTTTLLNKNIIGTDARKSVMSNTRVNKNNLSKYISLFKEKGIIEDTGNGWVINEMFKPIITNDKIYITFVLDLIEEDDEKIN